jgi:hypothetical protein
LQNRFSHGPRRTAKLIDIDLPNGIEFPLTDWQESLVGARLADTIHLSQMKHYNRLHLALALLLLTSDVIIAEVISLPLVKTAPGTVQSATINVPAGKVFESLSFTCAQSTATLSLGNMNVAASTPSMSQTNLPAYNDRWHVLIAGPAVLTLSIQDSVDIQIGQGCLLTYKLTDNASPDAQISPFTGTSVVIPSDAAGPVQIILESSTDLLNWAVAIPGSYGASTERRFFRVRAVTQ